jgi:hypothetical protein
MVKGKPETRNQKPEGDTATFMSPVPGALLPVSGFWFLVSGLPFLVSGFWFLVSLGVV